MSNILLSPPMVPFTNVFFWSWGLGEHDTIFYFFYFLYYFYLYLYPPDSQESDGGAIHRVSNYPDLLPEMPKYCCALVI